MSPRPVVIGVGNPLRTDDGIGVRLVEDLRAGIEARGSDVFDGGTGGLGLLGLVEDRPLVLLVDAAEMGEAPATVRVFPRSAMEIEHREVASAHAAGLEATLELVDRVSPETRLFVVAVEPSSVAPGVGLSEPLTNAYASVRNAVDAAVHQTLDAWSSGKMR